MRAKITHDLLMMPFDENLKAYLGYTDELLEQIELPNICLNDVYIGELEDNNDGTYLVSLSISNCNYLPRRVAIREPNESDIQMWINMIGEEN